MQRFLTTCSVLVLGAFSVAQNRPLPAPTMPPPPPKLLPVVPPPVDHPAYAGQPLMPQNKPPADSAADAAKPRNRGGRYVPPDGPVPGSAPGAAPEPARPAVVPSLADELDLVAARAAAAEYLRTRYRGGDLRTRLDVLKKGLDWQPDLEHATVAAAAAGKPVLWLQGSDEEALLDLLGVTLAEAAVQARLRTDFVVGGDGIERIFDVVGRRRSAVANAAPNGAYGRGLQLVVLAADQSVLQVLPGFWQADDLGRELRFALQLHQLWADASRAPAAKEKLFDLLQRTHVRRLPVDEVARSDWLPADRAAEVRRLERGERRDTAVPVVLDLPRKDETGAYELKPLCRLVHDRMLGQPFRNLLAFDMATFTDYGDAAEVAPRR